MALQAWNAVLAAPGDVTEVPEPVASVVEGVTAGQGSARGFFLDTSQYFDDRVALRGDVVGEPLAPATFDDGQVVVRACLSLDVANQTTDGPDITVSDTYAVHRLVATEQSGSLILVDMTPQLDDSDVPVDCVPPTLATDIQADWEAYLGARNAYWSDPEDRALIAAVNNWQSWTFEPGMWDGITQVLDGTAVDFAIDETGRTSARTSWCTDPSQNPEATITYGDGFTEQIRREATVAEVVKIDGRWIQNDERKVLQTELDDAPADLAQIWERCFG